MRADVTLGTVATELRRGLTLPGRVAAHLSDGMSVEVESGETGFVPALFIRDSGANDPPPVGTVLTVVLLAAIRPNDSSSAHAFATSPEQALSLLPHRTPATGATPPRRRRR